MILLFRRPVPPDAAYWPGRRLLAALDAVLWPAVWIGAAWGAPFHTGVVGPVVVTCALGRAIARLHTAISRNERYRFTTSKWGSWVVVLILVGVSIRILLATAGA